MTPPDDSSDGGREPQNETDSRTANPDRPRPVPGSDAAGEQTAGADGTRGGMSGGLWRFPSIALGVRNLRRNRLRTLLAALGIAIGVFVIVVLGVFGTVLQLSASQELGGIGNQVIVSPAAETGADALTPRQVQGVERAAIGRGTVVPLYTDNALVSAGGATAAAQILGVDNPATLFEGQEEPLPAQHRGGAFVGAAVANSLDVPVGGTVEVEGQQYRVVGLLAPTEDITPIQADNAIVLAEREFTGGYDQAVVVADSPEGATATAEEIRRTLNVRTEQVDIFELSEILDTIAEFFTLLNRFLIAIGSVSLIVAGVSIFNLMLMSTAERRGEIGLLRAVGIHRGSVLRMLLVEAALLGAIGGFFGAVLSGIAALALWALTTVGLDVVLVPRNAGYLLGGFVFGAIVALVSGAYPAWKAANERPVEALRG
jgi:putative ABC transport system permease protein